MVNPTGRGLFPSRLYAILDPAEIRGRPWESVLKALLEGGARVIQLRAKELSARELLEVANKGRMLIRTANGQWIVNDRVDVALAADADGVHLGQEDLPLSVARKLVGKEKLIGVSTHDLKQAREAEQGGADYIGFGPIFGTATKETGYAARGVEMLREACRAVKIPVVAIGGITEANVAEVWGAGADSAAMISDLMRAEDVTAKVRRILAIHKKAIGNRQ
ncbi:MAG: thiamine phosphate synthase [Deltaproteobacteria bacterium]|nr:thiamine phosphate synthase [Deltaproteobacteria bacterium]